MSGTLFALVAYFNRCPGGGVNFIHELRVDGVLGSWASFVSKMLHSLVPYRAEFLYTDVQSRGFVPWSVHKN